MEQLTFSGRSLDGDHLLLKDPSGQTYVLPVDTRLRTALRGQPERNGQLEIHMESTLRPRDIQARIRAGESAEAVAQAAGTSVDRIMPFAAPVLAERAHVTERAQLSSVRRRSGDSGARTLGEAVATQLRQHGTDPDTIEWDACRRDDGRWTLTGAFTTPERSGKATYSFDVRGNFSTADDDAARWLVGDLPDSPSAQTPADDLAAARQRRLSAASAEDAPLGSDAIEMVSADREGSEADDATLEFDAAPAPPAESVETVEPTPEPVGEPAANAPEEQDAHPVAEASTEPPAARKTRKRGRASVPSWDEIMFGGGKGD